MNISTLHDNVNTNFGTLTANDGYVGFNGTAVTIGQTFTVKARAYTFDGNANFNAATIGTFSGSAFLANNSGTSISDTVVVPEPTTYATIMGGCLLGVGALKRMRRNSQHSTDSHT